MKKLLPVLKMISFCLMLLFFVASLNAQIAKPQKMDGAQLKELEKTPALNNYLSKLNNTQKQKAKEKAQLLTMYLYKAVLHRFDKAKYPIDNNNKLEKRMAEVVAGLPEKSYQNANAKIQAALTDATKKQNDLGKYADVVFAGKTLAEQLRAKGQQLQAAKVNRTEMKIAEMARVDVLAHLVYCEDETNPESGDDDMLLGGLFFSNNDNVNGNVLYCGGFNDGAYAALNDSEIAEIKYSRKESFPQTFYGILILVNARSDEAAAVNCLQDIYKAAGDVIENEELPAGEETMAAMASWIETMASLLMDTHDFFTPFSIKLELRSANDIYINDSKILFNGNLSDTWGTGSISSHGGTYKIALKLRR